MSGKLLKTPDGRRINALNQEHIKHHELDVLSHRKLLYLFVQTVGRAEENKTLQLKNHQLFTMVIQQTLIGDRPIFTAAEAATIHFIFNDVDGAVTKNKNDN